MTAQDIHGWFVTTLVIVVVVLAFALPIVVFMTRRSARTNHADPGMPDYTALDSMNHANDHGAADHGD
jgi:heme/copper-type cytochrome/quinol oxidase subunit 2